MPSYSSCHPYDVLPLIYTGTSYNDIVYTAGTSGSVKGQYATIFSCFLQNKASYQFYSSYKWNSTHTHTHTYTHVS